MHIEKYEDVFDIEISNTSMPEELKVFMDKWGRFPKDELPVVSIGSKKFGLKEITMKVSEIYLYLDQISFQADEANACHVDYAFDLLNDERKIPESYKKNILVFKTIFEDKQGIKSFLVLNFSQSENKWKFNFIAEGFIIPPPRARFFCLVEE